MYFAKTEDMLDILSSKSGMPLVKLKNTTISKDSLAKIPARFASHYKVMPLEINNNKLKIAIADPLDLHMIDDLSSFLGLDLELALTSEFEIDEAIANYYGVGANTLDTMVSSGALSQSTRDKNKIEDLGKSEQENSIISLVNQILNEAVKEKATDIHLEPFDDGLRARFRIDGVLYNISLPESINDYYQLVVSRIKIMSDLNIAEKRLPQDGRMKVKVKDQELDLRISIIPSAYGEAVHIRVLSPYFFLGLDRLGLFEQDSNLIKEAIDKPHGIVLVTGPTGSGKSTTLYACLSQINSLGVKIVTIEDPIEYQLKGIIQIQTAQNIGLSFSQGLRHMLRHDPDVMMIGEIRDHETAEIAIRAALTGHLMFSTLHTNDASGAAARLIDMGIEPYLLSSSLEAIIAQRLVRTLCPSCKQEINPTEEILQKIRKFGFSDTSKIYVEGGCGECRSTGFRGRTGIYEVLMINEQLRELITEQTSSQKIKQKALSLGMRTLYHDGFRKAIMGITTVSEVLRVAQEEEL